MIEEGRNNVTLRNAHTENKRAKCDRSVAHLLCFIFYIILWFGLDFDFGLGLTLQLELGLDFGLDLWIGVRAKIVIFLLLRNVTSTSALKEIVKVNLHSIRFSYVFVRFFTFLLLLEKICLFHPHFYKSIYALSI